MKTITLKMNSYRNNISIVNNNNLEKRMLHTMLGFLGALALCYVFLLGTMVFNIVERRTLEANARSLSNEVGSLELEYLAESNKVDVALAQSLGFEEIAVKFATRQSLGSLKLAANEL